MNVQVSLVLLAVIIAVIIIIMSYIELRLSNIADRLELLARQLREGLK